MNKMRLQKLAVYGSCVTIKIVASSCRLISAKYFNNSVADFESSEPVGSSAKIILGFVIKARAAATRCFVPQISLVDKQIKAPESPKSKSHVTNVYPFLLMKLFLQLKATEYCPSHLTYQLG